MIFCLFLPKNKCCGCSLESPHRGDSNEHPQHVLKTIKIKYFSIIIDISMYLFSCVFGSNIKIGTVALQLNKFSAIMTQVVIAFTLQSLENLVHAIIPSILQS